MKGSSTPTEKEAAYLKAQEELAKMDVKINRANFEQAARIYATANEIAAAMHCTAPTLRKWCRLTYGKTTEKVLADLRLEGNIGLRSILWKHAQKNPATAIFLAKNYLGMADDPMPVDTGERQAELANALKNATKTIARVAPAELYESIPDAEFEEADPDDEEDED